WTVWEVATGKEVARLPTGIGQFANSVDRRMVAVELIKHRFRERKMRKGVELELIDRTIGVHLWELSIGKHLGQVGAATTFPTGTTPANFSKLKEVGARHGFRA